MKNVGLYFSVLLICFFTRPHAYATDFRDCTNQTLDCFSNINEAYNSFVLRGTDPSKTAVLAHGLSDSPYFLKDIAHSLNSQGYTVYVPLLRGHGGVPTDLHTVEGSQWLEDFKSAANIAQAQSQGKILVGGFSMGATIATLYALQDSTKDQISGLLLFAPAFKIKSTLGRTICNTSRNGIKEWASNEEGSSPIKYTQLSFRAVCELHRLNKIIDASALQVEAPVFMALTDYDKTISNSGAINIVEQMSSIKKEILIFSEKIEPSPFTSYIYAKEMAHTDLVFKEDSITQRQNQHFSEMEVKLLSFISSL